MVLSFAFHSKLLSFIYKKRGENELKHKSVSLLTLINKHSLLSTLSLQRVTKGFFNIIYNPDTRKSLKNQNLTQQPSCFINSHLTQVKPPPLLTGEMSTTLVSMLWSNFILGLNFISLCFWIWLCVIMI